MLQLKESQQREQALLADLEAAKKAQQEAQQQLQQAQSQVQVARDAPMATPSPSHRSMENGDPALPPSPPPPQTLKPCLLKHHPLSPCSFPSGPLFTLAPLFPSSTASPFPSCVPVIWCNLDDGAVHIVDHAALQHRLQ